MKYEILLFQNFIIQKNIQYSKLYIFRSGMVSKIFQNQNIWTQKSDFHYNFYQKSDKVKKHDLFEKFLQN